MAPSDASPPSTSSVAIGAAGEGAAAGAPKLGVHSAAAALGFHVEGDRPGDDLELSPVSPPSSDGEEAVLSVGCVSKGAGVAAALDTCSSFAPTASPAAVAAAAAAFVALGDVVDAVSVMLLVLALRPTCDNAVSIVLESKQEHANDKRADTDVRSKNDGCSHATKSIICGC